MRASQRSRLRVALLWVVASGTEGPAEPRRWLVCRLDAARAAGAGDHGHEQVEVAGHGGVGAGGPTRPLHLHASRVLESTACGHEATHRDPFSRDDCKPPLPRHRADVGCSRASNLTDGDAGCSSAGAERGVDDVQPRGVHRGVHHHLLRDQHQPVREAPPHVPGAPAPAGGRGCRRGAARRERGAAGQRRHQPPAHQRSVGRTDARRVCVHGHRCHVLRLPGYGAHPHLVSRWSEGGCASTPRADAETPAAPKQRVSSRAVPLAHTSHWRGWCVQAPSRRWTASF